MDTPVVAFCGRQFDSAELELICAVVKGCAGLSRMELARTVCESLQWARLRGGLKARECREFLDRLETPGECCGCRPSARASRWARARACR